jgi:hypothetical protein
MRRYVAMDSSSPPTDTDGLQREIEGWIAAVSNGIQCYLNRGLKLQSRTEYFNAGYGIRKYWVYAPPISSLTSIYEDSEGLWAGSGAEIDDSYVGADSTHVVLGSQPSHTAPKGIRVIYTGGLANHAVRGTFALSGASEAFTAGKYVVGSLSAAQGIVRGTPSTSSVEVENLYGIFEAAETLTEYSSEGGVSPTTKTAVISSITYKSMAEAHPAIVRACEAQVRYMWKHRDDFESVGTTKDSVNLRRAELSAGLAFTKEVVNLLDPYRRIIPQ